MATITFNIAKGRVAELARRVENTDPTNCEFVIILLKTAEALATLKDYDDVGTLLAAGGGTANVEADFTNYTRKHILAAGMSVAVDDTADEQQVFITDVTWTSAGGTADNSLVMLIVAYDPDNTTGTDSTLVPLWASDFVKSTNGGDLTADFDDVNGAWVAGE